MISSKKQFLRECMLKWKLKSHLAIEGAWLIWILFLILTKCISRFSHVFRLRLYCQVFSFFFFLFAINHLFILYLDSIQCMAYTCLLSAIFHVGLHKWETCQRIHCFKNLNEINTANTKSEIISLRAVCCLLIWCWKSSILS